MISNTISRAFAVLVALALLTTTLSCGGCGPEDNGGQTADVTIESIDPPGGYPGVSMTVTFSIEPGEGTRAEGMEWEVRFGDGTRTSGEGTEGTASHAYELAGQYDIEVSAIFDGETVGSAFESIRVHSPVELSITETRGAPANVRVGEELSASFVVANNTAAEVSTPYEVTVFLSESPRVDPEGLSELTELGTTTIEADAEGEPIIGSGETRSSAFSVTVPADTPSGDYYVVSLLDPRERIADEDRSNNLDVSDNIVRVENPQDALPDLCVRDAFVIPDRAFPQLNAVTRGFTLCNEGGEDAFSVVHRTYLSIGDDVLDEDDRLIHESEAMDVFAQSTVEIGPEQFTLDPGTEIVPDPGVPLTVYLIVEVVSEEALEEPDVENNRTVAPTPITVTDEPVEGPDIVVREFSVAPDSTFLNGSLEVTTRVANEGTVDVGSFFCGVYLGARARIDTQNDPRLTNINIAALPAGEERAFELPMTVPSLYDPGVYYIYIVCDPLNSLGEAFRSNNAMLHLDPVTITDEADVDLFVESFTVPATADEASIVTLEARVCVQGSNPSGVTQAQLFRSAGSQVDFNQEPILEFDVGNINPGDCLDVPIEIEAACDDFQDTYAYGVQVDHADRLPELDETNNQRAGGNALVVSGEFCRCDEDVYEPNDRPIDAVPVMPGSFDAAVCTAGNCDYFGVDLAAQDSIIVGTEFAAEKGELVSTLYDPSGLQVLDRDDAADYQEVASFLVPSAGQYIYRVCGATSARNLYTNTVTVLPQSSGVDVLPRDVTVPAGDSFSIGAELDMSFRIYNIGQNAASNFDAQFVISENKILGDADDTIVTTTGVSDVPAGGYRDLNVPITIPASLNDGDYYVAVELDPFGALTETDATNNVAFSRKISVRTECYDALEPNDRFADATEISPGSYSNLGACESARDYYRFCLADGKKFDVTIDFQNADGDLDLRLYNDELQQIDNSETNADVEQVSLDYVNGAQCFYVEVQLVALPGDPETTYSMTFNVQDVDPSLLCDSAYEPNDSFNNASSLLAALGQNFLIDRCPVTDTDYYYVYLTAGQTASFSATLDPAMQQGTLRLQLYKPTLNPGPNQETAPGVPTAQIANYTAPQTGQYYLQVTVSGTSRNVTYSLAADGLGGIDLAPSNLVIGPGTYDPGDEIRFGFDLTNLLSDDAVSPPYDVYFGTASTHDPTNDVLLGSYTAPDVPGNSTVSVSGQANVPASATSGTRYLHVVVDPSNSLMDANSANNTTSVTIEIN